MPAHNPMTMVMVDDDVDQIFSTRRLVRSSGIVNHFVSEHKSEKLIETLEELHHVHGTRNIVVLLDLNMPHLNGLEALAAIRAHSQFRELPVFIFSASNDDADRREALGHGANGYIVKSFTIDAFIAAMSQLPKVKFQLMQ